jgi:hypothetical protein
MYFYALQKHALADVSFLKLSIPIYTCIRMFLYIPITLHQKITPLIINTSKLVVYIDPRMVPSGSAPKRGYEI